MKVREPKPGEILGEHYVIEKELGRGGFGVVFKARHTSIERVVAIKVLLATYAAKDPSAKERFKREATIAASLDYPNSLRIFDYGETAEGVFYIVMEFVKGQDLGHVLATDVRLPIPRAIHIVRQVLHALMEAHARGIVHRDIKPDNVMLVPLAYDPDYVKVMDFGIAKMADSGEQITQVGITLGTPRYMPIEQLRGERLGPATDLYACGLLLFEMLVGRPAFSGDTAVDTALAVMRGPSVTVPEDARIPEALAAIIAKASARHAEDRYQNARPFLDALNTLDPQLLDLDSADRERFAAEGPAAVSAVRELTIDRARPKPNQDFEDVIKTQAVSTADILAASPPRGGLPVSGREAPTTAMEVVSAPPEPKPAAAASAPTVAVSYPGATTTVAVEGLTLGALRAPAPARPGTASIVMLVLNAATLVLVLILLLRSL